MAKDKKKKNAGIPEPGNGEDRDVKTPFEMMKEELEKHDSKEVREELEIEELEQEIEVLRKELENCKKLEDEYIDRIKRLQADYENYRKRTLKEHIEHLKRANKDLISKMLPIIDNFEIALKTGEKLKGGEDEFYRGVRMIYDKIMELLKNENVKVIDPHGQEFDPRICEAAVTEAVDDVDEGNILEVLRKGYMIDDFLIRPAVVKVCKKS
ncbi:MAG: nucleotide exchange factor GrpE [Actinobacteria bacterium]|nr:nucleotide exchange factor GrpE [Actinomycetota bacterium]